MSSTIRLYDKDPYQYEFDATVVSCTKCEKGYDVVLDATQFFPEQGGQECDPGTLNGMQVKDVQIKEDIIHHYVDEELNGKVHGIIDFEKRYDRMQNHSGEHCFSGICHRLYGVTNVGFRLVDDIMTIDFDKPLTMEQLIEAENLVNKAITDNLPIHCSYPENVCEIEYRSKKELNGPIRIVEIPGVDICACCAPHVHTTGEIGIFKVLRFEKHKAGIRIFVACGKRALVDYQLKQNEVMKISSLLSLPPYEISGGVEKLLQEQINLKQTISKLSKQILMMKFEAFEKCENYFIIEEIDGSLLNEAVKILLTKVTHSAAIFCPNGDGYRFVIASKTNEANTILSKLKEQCALKGGGKPDMVQGSIAKITKEEITEIIKKIQ